MPCPPPRPALGPDSASPDRAPRGAFARAWAADGGAHPGVRHPRNRRENEWSSLTNALIGAFAGLLVLVALWSACRHMVGEWRLGDLAPPGLPVSLRYPRGWRNEFAEDNLTYAVFVLDMGAHPAIAGPHRPGRLSTRTLGVRCLPRA